MYRARYRRIVFFFARVITSLIFWDLFLSRLGLRRWVRNTRPQRLRRIAVQYRNLAVEMGGVLIKVGQFLSSRVDVLPKEITKELSGLQDEVPPENYEAILKVAQDELGGSIEETFTQFDPEPLAAASLGQVHRAKLTNLHSSEENVELENVVVKVQRPNIDRIIAIDLAAIRTVGKWLKRYPPISRRADVPSLIDEFSRVLYEEIDYLAEGRNAEIFAENFSNRPNVRVPQVVWSYTTKRVLTLEDVYAIKITDYEAITAAGIDRGEVAQRLFETYLKQIFEDYFFHADPHPGNLFVSPINDAEFSESFDMDYGEKQREEEDSRGWRLTFVDFGMVGHVPPNLRAGLRELVIAVGTQDAERVVKAYQMLDVLLSHADLELIEKAEAKAFERFWGKSMSELQKISYEEMREFASEYRQIIYSMPFQVPSEIVYLVRCVAILSGMCTGLNPDFNVWKGLVPYARQLIAEEASRGWEIWLEEIGNWAQILINLPQRMDNALTKLHKGEFAVKNPQLSERLDRLELSTRRLISALIFIALLLGGIQLSLNDYTIYGGILLVGALVALIRSFFPGRIS